MLFDVHTRSVVGLGDKARIVNARFAAMAAHYRSDADFREVTSG